VGTEGKLGGQAFVQGVAGTWKDLTDNVNSMASNLTDQVRNIAGVTTAVANGDLSKKITVDVRGEILQLKNTINTMVDQLGSFAAEVTRVAREVGTEGKLGGQAQVRGVSGTWKDLTDNVNGMASNLTDQVRGIAKVVTAVANGDLKRKLAVAAKGEIAELADTINGMIDTLATFADQVTSVAREVGVEGKLGGQASVPGAAGTWKDLTDNVNQLAANLTTQVRAIAEVAIAVTRGDLTRSIGVETRGEVAILKDNMNEMIRNLRETTLKNSEQDWLKGNLAKFTRMLQGQRDLLTVSKLILSELAPVVAAHHGVFYIVDAMQGDPKLRLLASYAYTNRDDIPQEFAWGEGLVGQAAAGREWILLTDVPTNYIKISSGLGEAAPANIIVLPILFEGATKAVIELASFKQFSPTHQTFLAQLAESVGIVLNTIEANMRTEELLKQSQSLAHELQEQQEELQQTNAELQSKAKLLVEQNEEVERKNREVEFAKRALEEKAEQLALTSKYKSEFLSNMSHELRTPLNSLLILSRQLGENYDGNLTPKQVEFAHTIHAAGSDLLTLINDILDLSKIESGTVTVDVSEVTFADVHESMERTFRPIAEGKALRFVVDIDPVLPRVLYTDAKRLFQVLKNLLANAFKFTPQGAVELRVRAADQGWNPDHPILSRSKAVVAFSVSDTGIGIARDKQKVIFEAFQQADGSTSRKYGGTGLGLSISREIARLLGGEITLDSNPGQGSTFTLYLPRVYVSPKTAITLPKEPAESQPLAPINLVPREETERIPAEMADDRFDLRPDDFLVLIIEDDPDFAGVLLHVVRDRGYKGIVALRGETGFSLAREFRPQAITLDVRLPDVDGWDLLRRLREHAATSQIPIHVITGEENPREDASDDIITFLQKPVSKETLEDALTRVRGTALTIKNLLVVEDDPHQREAVLGLVDPERVHATGVGTGGEALEAIESQRFDCLVIDLRLPDMSGQQLIEKIRQEAKFSQIPIIVYTAATLSRREKARLKQSAQTIIQKDGRSPERLLEEVTTFLHKITGTGRRPKGDDAVTPDQLSKTLTGKKVLVVDDDIRNIFALTSLLERQNMAVVAAENGRSAITTLEKNADINIVLMDVMMPEMDGYETMRAIRLNPQFRTLPIIALTAKAMRGDREKCIDAGASDYVAKPVDSGRLLSLLHVWLHSEAEEDVEKDQASAE
jgi:signal transduction histidine kinase/CheY-like chemotaxis protein/HAMP domain-containing protein